VVRDYYVYILSNAFRTLYIGVTGDLFARMYEHKNAVVDGFTARYSIHRLVYFESTNDVNEAIEREKRLKRWVRRKKVALIERDNPGWKDLAASWFESKDPSASPRLAQDDT
jgi:putative endonuclease